LNDSVTGLISHDRHEAEMCKGFGLEHLKSRDCLEDTARGRYIWTIVKGKAIPLQALRVPGG
jgi:hypothetical protein